MSLEVFLYRKRIGTLERNPHGLVIWSPDENWARGGYRNPTLSLSFLREPGLRQAGTGLPSFFENLLPEKDSALRKKICSMHQLRETQSYELLRILGSDLPGAIEIRESDTNTSDEVLVLTSEIENQRRFLFSLAGMQLKFSMSLHGSKYVLPMNSGEGRWLVKVSTSKEMQNLAEVEFATMEWARACQFDVPLCRLIETADIESVGFSHAIDVAPTAFAIERFDRLLDGSRLHFEDFAQAFEIAPEDKYGGPSNAVLGFESMLRLVNDTVGESSDFIERLAFVIASGNNDAHLKNWAFVWPEIGKPVLSPCYDFVATVTWDAFGWKTSGGPSLNMRFGQKNRFDQLDDEALNSLGTRSGFSNTRHRFMAGLAKIKSAMKNCESSFPTPMSAALKTHWLRVPLLKNI